MAAAGHLVQLAEQRVDLGRRQACVGFVDQPGVQAQLAQHGQRAEDREPVGVHVVDQAEDLLPLPLQPRLVDLAVLRMQVDLQDLLLLGGQVGGHLFLGAPPDERLDPPLELGQALAVALSFDRPGVVVAEPVRAGEQPGSRDRQQRPQLHQVVLQRRARDRDLHRGRQPAGALVDLRLAVLDLLRLVQQQSGPAQLGVGREVDAQQGVGRDDGVGARGELAEVLAARGPRCRIPAPRSGPGRTARPRRPSSPPRWSARRSGTVRPPGHAAWRG